MTIVLSYFGTNMQNIVTNCMDTISLND